VIEFRLRNQLPDDFMESIEGHMLVPDDIDIMLRGPAKVLKPNGQPLCVYLPGAISKAMRRDVWPILQTLKGSYTDNRGAASGSTWESTGNATGKEGKRIRLRSRSVDSALIGAKEGTAGHHPYCRLTAWTGSEVDQWQGLWPLFGRIGKHLADHVPARYERQLEQAMQTNPAWVIKGTPFTTVTVNNTYATGVHKDKGDLEAGFSTLTVFREGNYEGGWICFPQYKLAVDMQDRDVLLMDAHDWHGNVEFDPQPKRALNGRLLENPGFERISVVSYFRTNMTKCGTPSDEAARKEAFLESKNAALVGE